MRVTPSLFDPPAQSVFEASAEWLTQLLTGSLVISLCVVAVAFIGLTLMTGRLAIRQSLRITLGCFLLVGAPTISFGLQGALNGTVPRESATEVIDRAPAAEPPLPPSTYDPYAGASFRPQ